MNCAADFEYRSLIHMRSKWKERKLASIAFTLVTLSNFTTGDQAFIFIYLSLAPIFVYLLEDKEGYLLKGVAEVQLKPVSMNYQK